MRYQIGVIGSGIEIDDGEIIQKARRIGRKIAEFDCTLITGGCGGLPYEAVLGAKEVDGYTIGISPASNLKEHIERYKMPYEKYDNLIFTGFGKKGRNVPSMRACEGVIAISGSRGTLNELTTASGEFKIMGLLGGVPGVSSYFDEIEKRLDKPGGKIIKEENPELLVENVFKEIKHYRTVSLL